MSYQPTHDELVIRAERWLRRQGCGVTIRDPFRAYTANGELPDAIGWRDGLSILVECKVSRSDFQADKNKPFRMVPKNGMGDWRFYLSPPDVVRPDDLPPGWGLLWATPKVIRKVHGFPGNCMWWKERPFTGCKRSETMMLVSALRRMEIRGHLREIYDGITNDAGND
ncbi:hypothetical protein [Thioalbus denitrificans]|uniref:hypothetical protein n=1 Tax=Thioalbus denitrificans TaxID=547122 RepID=UPI000DF1921C|nr:hypothetical protein [Thioalbus denitrificans]